jgi:hypothetical protein
VIRVFRIDSAEQRHGQRQLLRKRPALAERQDARGRPADAIVRGLHLLDVRAALGHLLDDVREEALFFAREVLEERVGRRHEAREELFAERGAVALVSVDHGSELHDLTAQRRMVVLEPVESFVAHAHTLPRIPCRLWPTQG